MNLSHVIQAIHEIDQDDVIRLESLIRKHTDIIMIGNGGSNAICSHIAQDYTKMLGKRALAFSDPSRLTCYINDFGMENAYQQFITDFETIDTLVILISSSGNSKNILNCAKHCVAENIPFIILTGFDSLNELRANYSTHAEIDMYVNSNSFGVVECVHQVFLHTPV
jgi:D-sedoheptulose 7-phosphate isomerase